MLSGPGAAPCQNRLTQRCPAIFSRSATANRFLGKETDINDSAHVIQIVYDRERKKLMLDEHFAGILHRRAMRDLDDVGNHDVCDGPLRHRGQQSPRGYDTGQLPFVVDDVEVDDALPNALSPDDVQSFSNVTLSLMIGKS